MRPLIFALLLASTAPAAAGSLESQAQRVTIIRDAYGIPHIRGKSDADAVFGMAYAQAEDDWNRVETNYLNALGRLAEAEGDSALWSDLRMRLYIDPEALKAEYRRCPPWLKALMTAWADGLNFYLATHPEVKPRAITRFEPWMALSFTEGSIGADYEKVPVPGVAAFYGQVPQLALAAPALPPEPQGSNGFAIAPSHSANGHALLWINPHTTFYFRSEAQVQSSEGLDVYGASTWGQFFVYQGFNRHMGWMHTTSGLDSVDEFALEVRKAAGGRMEYRYGTIWEPFRTRDVTLKVRQADGSLASRTITTFLSRHGPVTRAENGKWTATALMLKPRAALEQSWLRTKARDIPDFISISERRANSSNNSVLADDRGNIAFLLPQFVPRRDNRFDYTRPVDGSDPATRWQGEHTLAELPQVINPGNGWVMNVNNQPWTAAGADSPRADAFPRYMDRFGWNAREPHAIRVLTDTPKFTTDSLIAAGYDPWLPAFSMLVPTLAAAYDRLPAADPRRAQLAAPVAALKGWDCRTGEASAATSLAVYWAEALAPKVTDADPDDYDSVIDKLAKAPTDEQRLTALGEAVAKLTADFGRWDTPWGEINRLQRLSDAIQPAFDDSKPSLPIGMASAQWGALAAFGTLQGPGNKRRYGNYGNSFIAAVDFGPTGPTARAVVAGGQSGDPASPHFFDQAERYRSHDFRTVVLEATGKPYHPGER
jgi:acyl-homoserine-lactone acylase